MAEWNDPKIFNSDYNYRPDIETTRLDLYRLLNQFLASRKLSEMCKIDAFLNHAMYALDNFFEIEATRILLSSAVVARVIDDRDGDLKEYETKCGILTRDLKHPDNSIDLDLREACNKIIHARVIKYDIEVGIHGYDQRIFNPYIYYYGNHNGKEWKATLSIVDYVKNYTDNVM